MIRTLMPTLFLLSAALAIPAFAADPAGKDDKAEPSASGTRVFEMRTYTANEGKMEALHKRFREHTNRLFRKHGIEIVGYWTPQDEKDGKADKLVYLLAYPSRKAAEASWKAFRDDPEWQQAFQESHKDGVLVKKAESVFLDPTDYSPIK